MLLSNNIIKKIYRKVINRKAYQFAHGFHYGDGLGNLAVILDKQLKQVGCVTKNYCYEFDKKLSDNIYPIEEFNNDLKENDIAILHYTMDTPVNDMVAGLKCKRWLYYHNITPAKYFKEYNDYFYNICKKARDRLPTFAPNFDKCITPSGYNARELKNLNFKNIVIEPLPKDFSMLDIEPDKELINKFDDDYKNIIFVGRIVPHKNYKDLLLSYNNYKDNNPNCRLLLPGLLEDWYKNEIYSIISDNNIKDVFLLGRIKQNELNALYKISDLFLCLSLHEGYCMPIIESMYFRIPIIALNRGAVKSTVGDGGVVIDKADYKLIANKIAEIFNSKDLYKNIIKNQKRILKQRYGVNQKICK